MDQNALYKVILLGETHVGKSSFFVRYRDGRFVENLSGTLGLDETIKTVAYKDVTLLHNQAKNWGNLAIHMHKQKQNFLARVAS